MLLTLRARGVGASNLSFLLHKHPDRFQTFSVPFGDIHLFYPDAEPDNTAVTLWVEVSPVELVRRRGSSEAWAYVNDRAFAASSFLSVALNRVFRTAMAGRCETKPDALAREMDLEVHLPTLPLRRGGPDFLRRIVAPLGFEFTAESIPLDPERPSLGDSPYHDVYLRRTCTLQTLLNQLYVLLPVFDDHKHYWVGEDEVRKLERAGGEWLAAHPEAKHIIHRYLRRRFRLSRDAFGKIVAPVEQGPEQETVLEKPKRLHDTRLDFVAETFRHLGCRSVLDLGCGEGKLLRRLDKETCFDRIVGVEVALKTLERAERKLGLHKSWSSSRVELRHSGLQYQTDAFRGFDGLALVEVIEHLEPHALRDTVENVFADAKPKHVVVTTPNAEYNVVYEMEPGAFRHKDHRFEWSRKEFAAWADDISARFGYSAKLGGIGDAHQEYGASSQYAIFTRSEGESNSLLQQSRQGGER